MEIEKSKYPALHGDLTKMPYILQIQGIPLQEKYDRSKSCLIYRWMFIIETKNSPSTKL